MDFYKIYGDDNVRFGKKSVEICGELRKYKRVSKGQIKAHQESVENMFEDTKPLIKESEKLLKEYQEAVSELADLEETIQVMKAKTNPTNEELDKIIELINERRENRRYINELGTQMNEFNEKNEVEIKKILDEVPNNLAKLASQMVDISEEEFLENYTDDDELMVKHLAYFKQMSGAGKDIKDMEKLWIDIVDNERENKLNLSPSE